MATYLMGLAKTKDAEAEAKMISGMMPLFGRHEMELIAAPNTELAVLEGAWEYDGFFILKFPDREKAKAFLNDPEFLALSHLRKEAGDATLVVFDGFLDG